MTECTSLIEARYCGFLEEIQKIAKDPFASDASARRACLLVANQALGLPGEAHEHNFVATEWAERGRTYRVECTHPGCGARSTFSLPKSQREFWDAALTRCSCGLPKGNHRC